MRVSRRSFALGVCILALGGTLALGEGYEAVAVTGGGTIEGIVKLTGAAPKPVPIPNELNKDVCGAMLTIPLYEVGDGGGLTNVIVYLKDITKGKANPSGPVTLTNRTCAFHPRVQGAAVGQDVTLVSDDPMLHNTHLRIARTNATVFNMALPFKGFSATKPLPAEPELIDVKCDIHKFMQGWIMQFSHPYFATTDTSGHYSIGDVPPGSYTLVAWHEAAGEKQSQVTVTAGQSTSANFDFPPGK